MVNCRGDERKKSASGGAGRRRREFGADLREGGREDSPCRVAGRWVGEASREIPGGTGPTFPSGGPRRAGEAGDPRRQEEEAASSLFPPSLSLSRWGGGWLVGFPRDAGQRRCGGPARPAMGGAQGSGPHRRRRWPAGEGSAGRRPRGRGREARKERERGWEGRGGVNGTERNGVGETRVVVARTRTSIFVGGGREVRLERPKTNDVDTLAGALWGKRSLSQPTEPQKGQLGD